jgi:glycosyltransferase involved in cell wall biosynthesis
MEKEEYFHQIEDIRKKIKNDIIDSLDVKLEEMYNIKPVRLIWFVAKAELMLKQNLKLEEVYKTLELKGNRLYNYDGMNEYCELYLKISTEYNYIYDTYINKNICEKLNIKSISNISKNIYVELDANREKFIDDFHSQRNTIDLAISYHQINNYLMHEIVGGYGRKKNYMNESVQFIHDMPNMGYINIVIDCADKNVFIIVATHEEDYSDCIVLVNILVEMGKKVYFIDLPITFPVENSMDISNTLEVSINNAEIYGEATVIHPVELNYLGKSIGDNREYIIDYICKNYADNNLATILCSGRLIDELCQRPLLKKQMERLSPFHAEYLQENMTFGWVGNYLSYISEVYDFDVATDLEKPSECNFSIVIPARNSAAALRHTIKTCLNQRYKGSYEIVISDNSTNSNTEVYDLYCELNDPRIKYYKTPRDLHLPKSFEFAFLKAKGEFILSIGSDDALLPWTLEVLADVIPNYPEEEIFQWDRGFYAWPGFNGGQENHFVIPSKYEKDKYEVYNKDTKDYLAMILNNPQSMYGLPMLYINSGFRRSYLNTLINKTGRLWDGICQDIYIGVINMSINLHITNIRYPLAIAGMTGASIGAKSNTGAATVEDSNNRVKETIKTNNIGGFSTSAIERLMPEVITDISSLYNSLLRAIARGVLPIEFLDNLFNWKRMFIECINQLEVTDVLFDKKLHYFRYIAAKHGDEFLKWFDEFIYEKAIIPRKIDNKVIEEHLKRKTYKEGTTESGGQILDASRYGVTNVYEASLLFEKITQL